MPPDHESRPEQRHSDFNRQTEIIAKGVMLIGKVIAPLATAGLLVLIANHFQQKQLATDIGRMTSEIKEMRKEASIMSHKIAIMWSGGNWETKYRTERND
jgi:hypothetical protein